MTYAILLIAGKQETNFELTMVYFYVIL